MSIVVDRTNTTGCFSKFGRNCVQRQIIFKKKDEILFGKKKVQHFFKKHRQMREGLSSWRKW